MSNIVVINYLVNLVSKINCWKCLNNIEFSVDSKVVFKGDISYNEP